MVLVPERIFRPKRERERIFMRWSFVICTLSQCIIQAVKSRRVSLAGHVTNTHESDEENSAKF
jgi:hypothetical protein